MIKSTDLLLRRADPSCPGVAMKGDPSPVQTVLTGPAHHRSPWKLLSSPFPWSEAPQGKRGQQPWAPFTFPSSLLQTQTPRGEINLIPSFINPYVQILPLQHITGINMQ